MAARVRFPKPVEIYDILSFYGRNLVASEHEEWKRFRKVSAPSFSEVSIAFATSQDSEIEAFCCVEK